MSGHGGVRVGQCQGRGRAVSGQGRAGQGRAAGQCQTGLVGQQGPQTVEVNPFS